MVFGLNPLMYNALSEHKQRLQKERHISYATTQQLRFFCIKNIFLYKTLGFFSERRLIQPLQGTVLRLTVEHLQHLLETTALGFCSHLHYPFLGFVFFYTFPTQ